MARFKVKKIRRPNNVLSFITYNSAHHSNLKFNHYPRKYRPIKIRDKDLP